MGSKRKVRSSLTRKDEGTLVDGRVDYKRLMRGLSDRPSTGRSRPTSPGGQTSRGRCHTRRKRRRLSRFPFSLPSFVFSLLLSFNYRHKFFLLPPFISFVSYRVRRDVPGLSLKCQRTKKSGEYT